MVKGIGEVEITIKDVGILLRILSPEVMENYFRKNGEPLKNPDEGNDDEDT